LQIFDVDVGNDLALVIGDHVVDAVADVHMPVNAFGCAGSGIAATGFDQHANLAQRVLFIIGVVRKDF
jgi:hypothetical protein